MGELSRSTDTRITIDPMADYIGNTEVIRTFDILFSVRRNTRKPYVVLLMGCSGIGKTFLMSKLAKKHSMHMEVITPTKVCVHNNF